MSSTYRLGVGQRFFARHRLVDTAGNVLADEHSHHYRVQLCIEGDALDANGFLFDVTALRRALQEVIAPFSESNLDGHACFESDNSSMERFATVLLERLCARDELATASRCSVTLWEDDDTWVEVHR